MGESSHHTSSLREAMTACLVALGLCTLSLSIGAQHLKLDRKAWQAACAGAPRKPTAGNLMAAAAALTLLSVLLGAYHGARGVWSVSRAVRYLPTCCSGSWTVFRHRFRTKPFLWQLATSFTISLIFGCAAVDILIGGAMNELGELNAEACSVDNIAARGSRGVVGGGVLGLLSSLGSASLFVYTDVKERRKRKKKKYLSSAYYTEDALASEDEEGDEGIEPDGSMMSAGTQAVHVSSFSSGATQ